MNKPKPVPEKINEQIIQSFYEERNPIVYSLIKFNEIIDYLDYLAKEVRDLKERR